jgi:hypothetical protein
MQMAAIMLTKIVLIFFGRGTLRKYADYCPSTAPDKTAVRIRKSPTALANKIAATSARVAPQNVNLRPVESFALGFGTHPLIFKISILA